MLDEIVATKRADIERRSASHAADVRERSAARVASGRPVTSLHASLARPGVRVIAELKRRSPSAGDIATDVDIVAQARAYAAGGAAAVSVLTDTAFFGGSLADLTEIAAADTGLPVLRKDFLLDEIDVVEAHACGADAVLVIVRVLDDERLAALIAQAHELGMDALVEVHDAAEVARAVAAGARIIGVNNRDLDTFTIDHARTLSLAGDVPDGVVLIAESGIDHAGQVRELVRGGVRCMLVGSALMRSGDPALAVSSLVRAGEQPLVKLCGMRSRDDVRSAALAGASHVGVIATPGHRRSVEADIARDLCALAREVGVLGVAVVTDADADVVQARIADLAPDRVQLAGAAAALDPSTLTVPAFVVVSVADGDDAETVAARVHAAADHPNVAAVVLDTADATRPGGTGMAFDHARAAGIVAHVPVFIAGGLSPATASAALDVTGAAGIDVASGIETAGMPDAARMRAIVAATSPTAATPSWVVDERGRFSTGFGGSYIPETLVPAVQRLTDAWEASKTDIEFQRELRELLTTWVGRPTPLQRADRLTAHAGGARIWLKREDLCHTGAHKINNAIGQALLAKRMGLGRVIAETGAGQHGVATATACALLGLECIVYMGEEDIERQAPNVFRMQLLGATIVPVSDGTRTLKDAVNAAIRDWVSNVDTTFYIIGSALGMHPFPSMVRDFQRVIGDEVREQLPDGELARVRAIVACVGGGSNAIGIFHPFLDEAGIRLIGAEAGGDGVSTGRHAATISGGSPGVLHGMQTYLMQTGDGQVIGTHSISAGLDYPGVGPEHAHLAALGRAEYHAVDDDAALDAVRVLCRTEGIIPALESAHAIALGVEVAGQLSPDDAIIINVSGRGDKDLATLIDRLGTGDASTEDAR